MDIFTTQLARLAPNKIEPEKLRVKAIAKDARIHVTQDDVQEITDHDQPPKRQKQQANAEHIVTTDDEAIVDEEQADEAKQQQHHLDIYV